VFLINVLSMCVVFSYVDTAREKPEGISLLAFKDIKSPVVIDARYKVGDGPKWHELKGVAVGEMVSAMKKLKRFERKPGKLILHPPFSDSLELEIAEGGRRLMVTLEMTEDRWLIRDGQDLIIYSVSEEQHRVLEKLLSRRDEATKQ
jgi:hypothetical protein